MFWRNKRKIDFSWVSSDSRRSQKVALNSGKLYILELLKGLYPNLTRVQICWLAKALFEKNMELTPKSQKCFEHEFQICRKVNVPYACPSLFRRYFINANISWKPYRKCCKQLRICPLPFKAVTIKNELKSGIFRQGLVFFSIYMSRTKYNHNVTKRERTFPVFTEPLEVLGWHKLTFKNSPNPRSA